MYIYVYNKCFGSSLTDASFFYYQEISLMSDASAKLSIERSVCPDCDAEHARSECPVRVDRPPAWFACKCGEANCRGVVIHRLAPSSLLCEECGAIGAEKVDDDILCIACYLDLIYGACAWCGEAEAEEHYSGQKLCQDCVDSNYNGVW